MITEHLKIPTNLWYLDLLTRGGLKPGQMISILAPPGGAKTLCALELAYVQAYSNQHVAFLSTEHPQVGDVNIRLMSLVTGKERRYFEGGIEYWSEYEKQALSNKMSKFDEYLHFLDYTQRKPATITEMFNPVVEMVKEGRRPNFVIIDWWGTIKDAMLGGIDGMMGGPAKVRMGHSWLKDMRKQAEAMNVIPIIFHQLSGVAAGKRGGSIIGKGNAQEDKRFEDYFDYNITFGPKDSESHFMMNLTQSHHSDPQYFRAYLNGAKCKIDPVEVLYDGLDVSLFEGSKSPGG